MSDSTQPAPLVPPKPQTVPTGSLRANPHNPRMLFDEEPLITLENSIRKVGILVPITVYQAAGSSKFTILDGQRRWICAQKIGLKEVPINAVTEPSLAQNIVTMFQIHKLRKDWELMPTALKLGVLMKELDEVRDSALADLTGLDTAVVIRCKKLLSFETRYQDRMLEPDPSRRLTADLFIEMYPIINDRSVKKAPWYDRTEMIDSLVQKYLEKKSGFKAVTDFRKIKSYLTAARQAGTDEETVRRMGEFVQDHNRPISYLQVQEAAVHQTADGIRKSISKIASEISSIDPDLFAAEEEFWKDLEKLVITVRAKLAQAERRAI